MVSQSDLDAHAMSLKEDILLRLEEQLRQRDTMMVSESHLDALAVSLKGDLLHQLNERLHERDNKESLLTSRVEVSPMHIRA